LQEPSHAGLSVVKNRKNNRLASDSNASDRRNIASSTANGAEYDQIRRE